VDKHSAPAKRPGSLDGTTEALFRPFIQNVVARPPVFPAILLRSPTRDTEREETRPRRSPSYYYYYYYPVTRSGFLMVRRKKIGTSPDTRVQLVAARNRG